MEDSLANRIETKNNLELVESCEAGKSLCVIGPKFVKLFLHLLINVCVIAPEKTGSTDYQSKAS